MSKYPTKFIKILKWNENYNYIYDNVVDYCVEQIENGNYEDAYSRYKSSILTFEEQFAKPVLT